MTEDFGQRLQALRESLGMTQVELAARAIEVAPKFRRDYVSKVESGSSKLKSADTRKGLAYGLGLSSDDFDAFVDGKLSLHEAKARTKRSAMAAREVRVVREAEASQPAASPLINALFRQMDVERFAPTDFDKARDAVVEEFRSAPPNVDYDAVAHSLLVATRSLRKEGLPLTSGAIWARVALGRDAFAAKQDGERIARATDAADETMRSEGYEANPTAAAQARTLAKKNLSKLRDRDEG